MTFNEVRKDYLLDRWVVIATKRGRRPTDFVKQKRSSAKIGVCPLEPGNEHMTPPAVLVYTKSGKKILKDRDRNGARHKDWLIRVVPNLYPAFCQPKTSSRERQLEKDANLVPAIGHHEVLVESPIHDEGPANAPISQLVHVINGYTDRLRELSAERYVKYVSIFRNYGLEAGASLSHAHSQLIATPFVPEALKAETAASKKFWVKHKKCFFCKLIEEERNGPRSVFENSYFVVFTPYASVNPMEFWIFPKKHENSLLDMSRVEVRSFARTLRTCLRGLKTVVNDPPYNYGFHLTIDKQAYDHYHWHLEVYPKLSIWAGFEKSTGVYINTVTPELAADALRKVVHT